ncbi:hypothetical protein [Bacillus toyonensis]|uniref:hypothetical protein n=2 Tax=Bacillus TaxID=1386 RepID=UPI000BF832C4|nr:hypothetical protein [Bacillus toyonensis]PGA83867.1 hypothetical protein COL90_03145 [Bacillus toyonensis]
MTNEKQKDLPFMHKVVLGVLPVGRSNAITTKEIMTRVKAKSKDERQIREVLSELSTVYKQPVASTSEGKRKGFFIVETLEDFLVGDRALAARELHIKKRRNSFREACAHLFGTSSDGD